MAMKIVHVGDTPRPADPIALCKTAFREGADICRIDTWHHVSNSGKTDYEFFNLTPSKRPNWTARDGYIIDRGCQWWQMHTLGEKIQCMP
jgi:hypothetical protein